MIREKNKRVIQVFDCSNCDAKPYLMGTYDNWERANSVLAFFKWVNEGNPHAYAEAIEDSDYSDMLTDYAPAS